jgi:iron complex transport system ATP-binding protein
MTIRKPILRVRNLAVSRGARRVLSGIDFEAYPGEVLGILGPNGSGKSTLLEALISALPRDSGTIELFDRDVATLSSRERAKLLAYLGQTENLPAGLTVRNIVALGRLAHRSAYGGDTPQDERAIARAMVGAKVEMLAEREATKLSSGERARVGVARVLAQEASVLLMDEPTAHLDLGHRLALLHQVQNLAKLGYALLVVLHDLELAARVCSRALVLCEGQLLHVGTIEQVLTRQVMCKVFGVHGSLRWERGRITGLDVDLPWVGRERTNG